MDLAIPVRRTGSKYGGHYARDELFEYNVTESKVESEAMAAINKFKAKQARGEAKIIKLNDFFQQLEDEIVLDNEVKLKQLDQFDIHALSSKLMDLNQRVMSDFNYEAPFQVQLYQEAIRRKDSSSSEIESIQSEIQEIRTRINNFNSKQESSCSGYVDEITKNKNIAIIDGYLNNFKNREECEAALIENYNDQKKLAQLVNKLETLLEFQSSDHPALPNVISDYKRQLIEDLYHDANFRIATKFSKHAQSIKKFKRIFLSVDGDFELGNYLIKKYPKLFLHWDYYLQPGINKRDPSNHTTAMALNLFDTYIKGIEKRESSNNHLYIVPNLECLHSNVALLIDKNVNVFHVSSKIKVSQRDKNLISLLNGKVFYSHHIGYHFHILDALREYDAQIVFKEY